MTQKSSSIIAAEIIAQHAPDFRPQIGLVLGSGLGSLADQIQNPIRISYADLPDFPVSTVAGHEGCLVLGELGGLSVACFQGRVHSYEGATAENFKTFIRALKLLGCESLLITNSSGSLRPEVGPGQLVLISDHINLHPGNPLVGPNDEEFGPRFFAMDDAYDKNLRARFHQVAKAQNIPLVDGVYIGVIGPGFETPAEIRAFRILGGEVIGMSTIPEVLVARHCGLRVAVVAVITNFAAGMTDEQISHEGTLHYGKLGAGNLTKLLVAFIASLNQQPC